MIVYIVLAAITIFVASLVRSSYYETNQGISRYSREHLRSNVAMVFIFVLLFLVCAGRYHVGNDYTRYEEFFHLIPLKQVVPTEFGFNKIVLLMQALFGIETKLTIFAFFGFVTIFFMLVAIWEQSESFVYSFFLFMMMGFYYQSLNTVRYYVAWAVALWCLKFVEKKQYIRFVLVVLLTATIHKSILIILPVFVLAQCPWKKWYYVCITLFAASGLVLGKLYLKIIMRLYPSYKGTAYLDGGTSIINIIKLVMVMLLAGILLCKNKELMTNDRWRLYFHLNFMALLLYLGGSFIPEISRIGYYLTGCQIFFVPMMAMSIENGRTKKVVNGIVIGTALVYFVCMLIKGQEHLIRIVPYHTWLLPGNIVD